MTVSAVLVGLLSRQRFGPNVHWNDAPQRGLDYELPGRRR